MCGGANDWLVRNAPPFFILVGVCGAFFFVMQALQMAQRQRVVAWVMSISGNVAGVKAVLFALDLVSYRAAQSVGMGMGPLPLLLVLPQALR